MNETRELLKDIKRLMKRQQRTLKEIMTVLERVNSEMELLEKTMTGSSVARKRDA